KFRHHIGAVIAQRCHVAQNERGPPRPAPDIDEVVAVAQPGGAQEPRLAGADGFVAAADRAIHRVVAVVREHQLANEPAVVTHEMRRQHPQRPSGSGAAARGALTSARVMSSKRTRAASASPRRCAKPVTRMIRTVRSSAMVTTSPVFTGWLLAVTRAPL